jgi:hypothetical protein
MAIKMQALHIVGKNEVWDSQIKLEDPVLNTDALMKLLAVSRRTVQTWRDTGQIEFSAVKSKFYYRLSAIEKMLDNNLVKLEVSND